MKDVYSPPVEDHRDRLNMAPPAVNVEEHAVESSGSVIKKEVKRSWVSYIWDTLDKSPEERRLLFKLDSALLTLACLGVFYLSDAPDV